MRPRKLSEVARGVGGRLAGYDAVVRSVVVDSRRIEPGSLFFALRGERADGHEYVAAAFEAGAAGAVVERGGASGGPTVVVPDTSKSLLTLATAERVELECQVVGITGSTGKTCTKDFAASVLGARFEVVASAESFNNEVGLPLTVLAATDRTEVLVCEMGSRGIGHIRELCRVARPTVGVVTNVGLAHLGLFGSRENIVRAKAELVEALPPDGVAVLNADDPAVRAFAERTPARVLSYGVDPEADVRAEEIALDADGRASFVLSSAGERQPVELAVPGEHMVWNALAAAAAGIALGVTPAECAAALKDARVSGKRMETFDTEGGVRVLNDSYNANPTSMAAALRSAVHMARSRDGRCWAVLGHMAELGPASPEEHRVIGALVASLGVARLVTVGEEAEPIAEGARHEGLSDDRIRSFARREEALDHVRGEVRRGDVVLVKASRVAGLEDVAEGLKLAGHPHGARRGPRP